MDEKRGHLVRFVWITALMTVLVTGTDVLSGRAFSISLIALSLIGYAVITALLTVIERYLPWTRPARALTLFALLFGVMTVNIAIELLFFSTMATQELQLFALRGLVLWGIYAVAVVAGRPASGTEPAWIDSLRGWWLSRSALAWGDGSLQRRWPMSSCILWLAR